MSKLYCDLSMMALFEKMESVRCKVNRLPPSHLVTQINEELADFQKTLFGEINPSKSMLKPLNETGVSIRAFNCLSKMGVKVLGDLTFMAQVDLLKLPNFGRRCLKEIESILDAHNLQLKGRADG